MRELSMRKLLRGGTLAVVFTAAAVVGQGSLARAEGTATPQLKTAPMPRLYADVLAEKYFPNTAQKAPTQRIFRLTRDQLDATVRTLLPTYVTQPVKSVMARDPVVLRQLAEMVL